MLQYQLAHPYLTYVLFMVTLVYLLNQVDRYLYSSEAPPFVSDQREFEPQRRWRSARFSPQILLCTQSSTRFPDRCLQFPSLLRCVAHCKKGFHCEI